MCVWVWCKDSVPATGETRVRVSVNWCLPLESGQGCGRTSLWCQLLEPLGSQCQLLEQLGSLTSTRGAGTVCVPKPVAGGGPGLRVSEGLCAGGWSGTTGDSSGGLVRAAGGGQVSVSSPNQAWVCVCSLANFQLDQPAKWDLRSRYQVGVGSVLVRPGGLANVERMRDECVSGYEAFSASVCLQTKYKMGFTLGYNENMGQQSVLRCLLYVYLWCRAFLSSTAPSRFLSKAW